eukprot:351248-Chlamydomonas_euryale.AAC.2
MASGPTHTSASNTTSWQPSSAASRLVGGRDSVATGWNVNTMWRQEPEADLARPIPAAMSAMTRPHSAPPPNEPPSSKDTSQIM